MCCTQLLSYVLHTTFILCAAHNFYLMCCTQLLSYVLHTTFILCAAHNFYLMCCTQLLSYVLHTTFILCAAHNFSRAHLHYHPVCVVTILLLSTYFNGSRFNVTLLFPHHQYHQNSIITSPYLHPHCKCGYGSSSKWVFRMWPSFPHKLVF